MATTQMNIRIDAAVKPVGDSALASIGFTPSSVVQAVWDFASRNRFSKKELRKLGELLDPATAQGSTSDDGAGWVDAVTDIYGRMLAEMGIEGKAEPLPYSDDELLFAAHSEKLAEREGLS